MLGCVENKETNVQQFYWIYCKKKNKNKYNYADVSKFNHSIHALNPESTSVDELASRAAILPPPPHIHTPRPQRPLPPLSSVPGVFILSPFWIHDKLNF